MTAPVVVTLTLTFEADQYAAIERVLEATKELSLSMSSHGALDLGSLVTMLLQDVAFAETRPGSWEGANMNQVLRSHGYDQ